MQMDRQKTNEVPEVTYMVRFADAGDPVAFSRDVDPGTSVFAMKDPTKPVEQVSETFTLDRQPNIDELLTKNGRHYQVAEPEFNHLKKRWGNDSVFVKPITEERFRELSGASVDQEQNP
jgi:hypothetical protein